MLKMPDYLSPGVYIEEFELGALPIEGFSTSTAGFLGLTERGPTKINLVTSWNQFQRVYGSYFLNNGDTPFLPYAVAGFFINGGQRCYIGRITLGNALSAEANLLGGGTSALTVKAVGPGAWGNNIIVAVDTGSLSSVTKPLFKLRVFYWKNDPSVIATINRNADFIRQIRKRNPPDYYEEFDNISMDRSILGYFGKKVCSSLVTISPGKGDTGKLPDSPIQKDPTKANSVLLYQLAGGSDGTGTIGVNDYTAEGRLDSEGMKSGLNAFRDIDEIAIVYVPHALDVSNLVMELIEHCESLKDRFLIIDTEPNKRDPNDVSPRDTYVTRYAAFYYPWIKIIDPMTQMIKTIPPGGYIAGIYARSDIERGVHKAPANEVVLGANALEFQITRVEQDILNSRGVNVIRAFPGREIRVWGARTLSSDPLWKYINVRRLFSYLEESIEEGTQWVVFEPNNEKLWARVRATITQFLTSVWHDGALMGTKPEEAFFVRCDRTTMTQDDIDNGRLVCIIGIAPVKPAEFVIFRITQWQGGSAVTE